MHRDVEAADRTLMRLSDLLRMTLENLGQQEVTLKAELEFLSKYLEIEQTRFADRLDRPVRHRAGDARRAACRRCCCSRSSRTPSSTASPRRPAPATSTSRARRDGDKLWIEVRDDGVGLSEDALTALQKGIGVSTTRARLQHLFGADFRFEFHRLDAGRGGRRRGAVARRAAAAASTPATQTTRRGDRRGRPARSGAIGAPARA